MTLTSPPISVALARFEDITAFGLRSLIEAEPSLTLVAADVDHGRLDAAFVREQPDVAILNLGVLTSPAELRDLSAAHPQTRLLVLADTPSPTESRQLIGFGATACLARTTDARDIVHAIHLASRGMHVLPGAADGDCAVEAAGGVGPAPLTDRETDVLALLQDGRSNAEIAAELHVGVETVRTHARHIYGKLGVSTRRELRPPT